MEILKRLLSWRWDGRWWTYENGLLLFMIGTGFILLTAVQGTSTALLDIHLFFDGRIAPQVLAGSMIACGLAGLNRRWNPYELFLLYLPMSAFFFIIAWMTFMLPAPNRPLARLWSWGAPLWLTTFYMLGKFYGNHR